MIWRATDPEGCESKKIVWEVAPYLRGTGLDIGAGVFKVLPHVISVDNGHHEAFGHSINPDVKVQTAERMPMFASNSMDFVFSSHLLEHIEDYKAALKEWWRVIKQDGKLILYLPHKDFYPSVGQPGANPDHKHDFAPQDIIDAMCAHTGWDLLECQERNEGVEYSMLLVFRKVHGREQRFSYRIPKPAKTALVCRFGAYGDLLQATSVLAGLKEQGYHITLMASFPGLDVVSQDPNIDAFMVLDKDQVPNADLGNFWAWQGKKYDKFVNLSESVEGTWLALPGRTQHDWAPLVRHKHMNFNYLEFQHQLAGVPHKPQVKFYPTVEEKAWAVKQRAKMGTYVIVWALSGSSVHKTWAGMDRVIAAVMLEHPEVHVVLVGGPEGVILEAGWENEPRVHMTCGKWSIRETLSFLEKANLVIGPETGVLNAAAHMEVPKVCFLSHSSEENLTRDWRNTVSLQSRGTRCRGRDSDNVPACHQMHYGWNHCTKDEETGTAQCQKDISVEEVYYHVDFFIKTDLKKVA
jgi:ADP-heptose:LPS heptosyltransferase/predicted SAM-dependent methyltransferase